MANTTWNPSDKSVNITLSGGNLIATPIGQGVVRSTDRQVTGKFYWEYTFGTPTFNTVGFGIGNANALLTTAINTGVDVAIVNSSGTIAINGVGGGNIGAFSAGGLVCLAVDVGSRLIWFRNGAAGNWNGVATANPATGVGGLSISSIGGIGIPIYAVCGANGSQSATTANFGDSAFTGAVPSGFTSGFPSNVGDPNFANVVLLCHADGTSGSTSFSDSSGYAHTLSPNNVTVTTTSPAPKFGTGCANLTIGAGNRVIIVGGAAADFNFGSGQFTVEASIYCPSVPSGIAFLSQYAPGQASWMLGRSGGGALFFDYSTNGSADNLVQAAWTPTLNTWIHVAADRDTSNVLRVYADGVVIASATAAATFFASTAPGSIGSNGYSQYFPGYIDEVRVTKGVARYAGAFTPPTAPFPDSSGVSIPTNALATQAAVEHWLTTDPPAQVTQVALEHWATVTGTGVQATITQIALEHWASVANVPLSVGAPIISMIM